MALPEEYLRLDTEQQRAALVEAIGAYKRADPSRRKQAGREALIRFAGSVALETQTEVARQEITDSEIELAVWQPMVDGIYKYGLTVPFRGLVMDCEQFKAALQGRLEALIGADSGSAKKLLTDSPEYNSDLHSIGMSTSPKDWPIEIMMCDQMMILLNRIDYAQGQNLRLLPSEMPGLQELLEQF